MQENKNSFYEGLNKKHVIVTLQSGEKLSGILSANAFNQFDVLLDMKEQSYLLTKASIVKIMFSGGVGI